VVRRTGRDVGWLQVEFGGHSASGVRGWVYSDHLRPVEELGETPLMRPGANLPAEVQSKH
jgi:hypothetical protein